MINRPTITQPELVEGLRRLGLRPEMTVMAHSSLSAFGHVEGGEEAVIRALLTVIGENGTLCLPTLCQRDRERRQETWDIEHSPSDVGKITEVFRKWPGVVRSDHFSHSVAAQGPLAEAITAGHATAGPRPSPWGTRAFGHGSPWDRFYEIDVLYCLLGVDFRVNTMRHYIQSTLMEEALAQAPAVERAALAAQLADWNRPGVFPGWSGGLEEELLSGLGLVHYEQIGEATCRSIHARVMVEEILKAVRSEPEKWLSGDTLKWYRRCIKQAPEGV
ncbi:MAG: AAC(3) family N-acetyltransferase [Armatimonadota bacterium]